MDDLIFNSLDKIRKNFDSRKTEIIDSLKTEIKVLEKNQNFRNYIRETLQDVRFHENYPNSYRKFPFEIITFLSKIGVPPEDNFLIQDIIDTFDINNKVFVEFLITELIIDYFPLKFIKEKIYSRKDYYKLHRLYNGY